MTTINKFDQQKQEILNFIFENLATPSKVSKLITLDKMVEKLQPPMPTCSTCDHTVKLTNCWMKPIIECGNEKSEFYCRVIYKPTVCIHHSDYGDAK